MRFACFALLALLGLALGAEECVLKTSSSNFNLSPLSQPTHPQTALDRDGRRTEYLYAWSICNDVDVASLPDVKDSPPSSELCKDKTGKSFQIIGKKDEGKASCTTLGSTYELSEITDGSGAGVTVKHTVEDPNCKLSKKRVLSVHYRCNQLAKSAPVAGTVVEKSVCDYHVDVQSVFGCPTQCFSSVSKTGVPEVCSGHGICSVDPTLKAARCYCNRGYRGNLCDGRTETPSSPTTILMVLVITLLIILIAAVMLILQRTRKLTSPENLEYAHMAEDGTLTLPESMGDRNTQVAGPVRAARAAPPSSSIDVEL